MKPKYHINISASLCTVLAALAFSATAKGAVSVVNTSNTISGGAGLTVSATDLVNQGQPTFVNYTSSKTPSFGAGAINDGVALNNSNNATFYNLASLPTTLIFNLDVSSNILGYDITKIDSFAGW